MTFPPSHGNALIEQDKFNLLQNATGNSRVEDQFVVSIYSTHIR